MSCLLSRHSKASMPFAFLTLFLAVGCGTTPPEKNEKLATNENVDVPSKQKDFKDQTTKERKDDSSFTAPKPKHAPQKIDDGPPKLEHEWSPERAVNDLGLPSSDNPEVLKKQFDTIDRGLKSLESKAKAKNELITKTQPAAVQTNAIGMKFKPLTSGTYVTIERQVLISLTKPFEIGVCEVTQAQYEKVMGTNPSKNKGPQNPVEMVSWDDAVEFCNKLSDMPNEKAAGYVYRLPKRAEWEYAFAAGAMIDDDSRFSGDYGWIDENSGQNTHPVGQKKPNAWGLFDMHGNVAEWVKDTYEIEPIIAGNRLKFPEKLTDPGIPFVGKNVFRSFEAQGTAFTSLSGGQLANSSTESHFGVGFRVARIKAK